MLAPGLYNTDCMQALAEYPDKYFDLAIVDPPYGSANGGGHASEDGLQGTSGIPTTGQYNRFGGRWEKYKRPF